MEITTDVGIRNRFEIVVKDARTGVEKQKGYANNIILDSLWDRFLNAATETSSSYRVFDYIYFGKGSGTPTPNRTDLFNRLGHKSSSTVGNSVNRVDEHTAYRTRSITLSPSEFVGETITEVGLGGTLAPYTHAMIKDSEGNPLSIHKTDLDIVTIYSTLYVRFEEQPGVYIYGTGGFEKLLDGYYYLLNNYARGVGEHLYNHNTQGVNSSITRNPSSRSLTYKYRKDYNQANGVNMRYIQTLEKTMIDLLEFGAMQPFSILNQQIGIGDGVTKTFHIDTIGTIEGSVSSSSGNIVDVKSYDGRSSYGSDVYEESERGSSWRLYSVGPYDGYFIVLPGGSYSYNAKIYYVEYHDHPRVIGEFQATPGGAVYSDGYIFYRTIDSMRGSRNDIISRYNISDGSIVYEYLETSDDFKDMINVGTDHAAVLLTNGDIEVYSIQGGSMVYNYTLNGLGDTPTYTLATGHRFISTRDGGYILISDQSGIKIFKKELQGFVHFGTIPGNNGSIYIDNECSWIVTTEGKLYIRDLDVVGSWVTKFEFDIQFSLGNCVEFKDSYICIYRDNQPTIIYHLKDDDLVELETVYSVSLGNGVSRCVINEDRFIGSYGYAGVSTYFTYARASRIVNTATLLTTVEFDTPPPPNQPVIVSYDTVYFPKTQDYVVDVEWTLQFNEGVDL